jgi:Domain of unknown function (DUF4105)
MKPSYPIYLLLFWLAFYAHSNGLHAQSFDQQKNRKNIVLDTSSEVSLLTCNPGNEVYSTFGHSAFYIKDTVHKIDRVYNYGTFSYDDDFLYKFLKGDLDYFLSVSNLEEFMWEYEMENRGVTKQVLNLSWAQKQKLYELLQENYLPQNRVYHYDFLFDNCSTRLRDILEKATHDGIHYDFSFITISNKTNNQSYRNMIDDYAAHLKWLTFGMDLMIGVPSDHKAKPREHLFLPDNLMNAYFFATIQQKNGAVPLVKKTSLLLTYDLVKKNTPFFESPLFVCLLFLLMTVSITFWEYKFNKWHKGIDVFFAFIFAIIGCLFLFMWTSTRHHVAYVNLNLIWANPLLIIAGVFFFTKKYKVISNLMLFYSLSCLFLILSWRWLLPQDFNIALLPFFIALFIRTFYIYFYTKAKSN